MTADYFLYTVGIVVPKTVTRIRIHHSVKHIPDFAFVDCTNLAEVDFHEGLYSIGNGAFKNCISLRRCNIPSSVRTIGGAAFYACTALVELELHDRAFIQLVMLHFVNAGHCLISSSHPLSYRLEIPHSRIAVR